MARSQHEMESKNIAEPMRLKLTLIAGLAAGSRCPVPGSEGSLL